MSESTLVTKIVPDAELVFDAAQIATAIDKLADGLNEHYRNQKISILCVMQGGLVFTGHLLTRLEFEVEIDYLHATRYRNSTTGNDLQWLVEPRLELKDKKVLILDDILDEGITLDAIIKYCHARQVAQVNSAVLLDKQHDRCVEGVEADFSALTVDDRYVFGFGMDYEGSLRNINAIYATGK